MKGNFRDGDCYLFVYDFSQDGTTVNVARGGGNKGMLGKEVWTTKDPDGKAYVQEFVKVGKGEGNGWVDYKRTNSTTGKIEPKSSYLERIPNAALVVGCGFYKE